MVLLWLGYDPIRVFFGETWNPRSSPCPEELLSPPENHMGECRIYSSRAINMYILYMLHNYRIYRFHIYSYKRIFKDTYKSKSYNQIWRKKFSIKDQFLITESWTKRKLKKQKKIIKGMLQRNFHRIEHTLL